MSCRKVLIYRRIGGEAPEYIVQEKNWKDVLKEILTEIAEQIERCEEYEVKIANLSTVDFEKEKDFRKRISEAFKDEMHFFYDVIVVERWCKSHNLYYWDEYRIVKWEC